MERAKEGTAAHDSVTSVPVVVCCVLGRLGGARETSANPVRCVLGASFLDVWGNVFEVRRGISCASTVGWITACKPRQHTFMQDKSIKSVISSMCVCRSAVVTLGAPLVKMCVALPVVSQTVISPRQEEEKAHSARGRQNQATLRGAPVAPCIRARCNVSSVVCVPCTRARVSSSVSLSRRLAKIGSS